MHTQSQVTFRTDTKLKQHALQKAKLEGITLKALLVKSMQAFVNGHIGLGLTSANDVEEVPVHRNIQKKMDTVGKLLAKKLNT